MDMVLSYNPIKKEWVASSIFKDRTISSTEAGFGSDTFSYHLDISVYLRLPKAVRNFNVAAKEIRRLPFGCCG